MNYFKTNTLKNPPKTKTWITKYQKSHLATKNLQKEQIDVLTLPTGVTIKIRIGGYTTNMFIGHLFLNLHFSYLQA